jgi:hypothetical protein
MEPYQLIYVDLYFVLFMYAIMGLFGTGFFIIGTELLIYWEEKKVNRELE